MALAAMVAWGWGCGSDEGPEEALRDSARELTGRLEFALQAANRARAPYRCARTALDPAAPRSELGNVAGRSAVRQGDEVVLRRTEAKAGDGALTLGILADARGADAATAAAMGQFHAAFEEAGVDIVVMLGGMGSDADALAAHLDILGRGSKWPIVVVPGDREAIPALRTAIERSGGESAERIDATRTRLLIVDDKVLGLFPGLGRAERLVAAREGCVHDAADAQALAARLAARSETKVWLSYAPPRQAPASGSDVALGGVHIGESEIGVALASSGAGLAIHAALEEAAMKPARGAARLDPQNPVILGAGAVDPLPLTVPEGALRNSRALVVEIRGDRVTWERIAGP